MDIFSSFIHSFRNLEVNKELYMRKVYKPTHLYHRICSMLKEMRAQATEGLRRKLTQIANLKSFILLDSNKISGYQGAWERVGLIRQLLSLQTLTCVLVPWQKAFVQTHIWSTPRVIYTGTMGFGYVLLGISSRP